MEGWEEHLFYLREVHPHILRKKEPSDLELVAVHQKTIAMHYALSGEVNHPFLEDDADDLRPIPLRVVDHMLGPDAPCCLVKRAGEVVDLRTLYATRSLPLPEQPWYITGAPHP